MSIGRPGARTWRQRLIPRLWEEGGELRLWDPLQTLRFPFLQRRSKFTPSLRRERSRASRLSLAGDPQVHHFLDLEVNSRLSAGMEGERLGGSVG